MDIGDTYEQQQQHQHQHPQSELNLQHQQQQQMQMQMQCDSAFSPAHVTPTVTTSVIPLATLPSTNGFDPAVETNLTAANFLTAGQVIPLPAPPQLKPVILTPQQQEQIYLQQQQQQQQQQHQQHQQRLGTDIDIDSMLLQQFNCLGTTDHEDLIKQFQSLMNNQIDEDAAKFYLEMSNWNLQTAVGCYLDIYNFQTLPSMKIVQQARPSEYQQSFRLQNDGTIDWPAGCYLTSPSQKRRIEVPALKSGETCDILADIAPNQPAIMWRLCTPNGWNIGEPIWMVPPGMTDTQAELSERMSQLLMSTDPSNNESCPQVHVVISVNME